MTELRTRPRLPQKVNPPYLDPETEKLLEIPAFLDRRKWTKEDWERHERARDALIKEIRAIERAESGMAAHATKLAMGRAKRSKQRKILQQHRKRERATRKEKKRIERVRKKYLHSDQNDTVYKELERGFDTSGKITKRVDLTSKEVRHALRRLVKTGRAVKLSPRRYKVNTRKRSRLPEK